MVSEQLKRRVWNITLALIVDIGIAAVVFAAFRLTPQLSFDIGLFVDNFAAAFVVYLLAQQGASMVTERMR
jgi:hypothetical protein